MPEFWAKAMFVVNGPVVGLKTEGDIAAFEKVGTKDGTNKDWFGLPWPDCPLILLRATKNSLTEETSEGGMPPELITAEETVRSTRSSCPFSSQRVLNRLGD